MTPPLSIDFSALSGTTRSFLVAGAVVALATLLGFLVERLLVAGLRKLATTTDAQIDDIIINSVRGVARWGFFFAGLFAAIPVLPIPAHLSDEITTASRLVVLIFSIVVAARLASGVAAHYAHRLLPTSVSIAKIVVNAAVLTLGLLIIFQTMGIKITAILTALGVGGLAIALALQDTLANFFAGVQILASKQINLGDYVQLDSGQEGFVTDIGWRSAILKMLNNNVVVVPNTKLSQAIVTNFSLQERDFAVRTKIGVSYDSDLERVERVTIEVAREVTRRVEGAVNDFDPQVRFHAFAESMIEFYVILRYHDYGAQFLAQHELVKALHQRYRQEGIVIPYPIRTVVMKGESKAS